MEGAGLPDAPGLAILAAHGVLSGSHPARSLWKGRVLAILAASSVLYPNGPGPSLDESPERPPAWPYARWAAGLARNRAGLGIEKGTRLAKTRSLPSGPGITCC